MNAISSVSHDRATVAPHRSLAERLLPWLRNRWVLLLGVLALVGAGLALGWPWLVAAGLAPLVLALLPCALMCAAGLCMMGKGQGQACAKHGESAPDTRAPRQDA